jgi:zinc transporter ZupT
LYNSRHQSRSPSPGIDEGLDAEAQKRFSTENIIAAKKRQAQSWRRIFMLVLAITIHNFPEGLAVGVGFGAIGISPSATFDSARSLAIGIGLQNFPEGLAVSLPLLRLGYSPFRAFWYVLLGHTFVHATTIAEHMLVCI